MRFLQALLFIPLLAFGAEVETRDPRAIIGGRDANIRDYPFMVYIDLPGGFCSGSVIHPRWVLTAAHCMVDSEGRTLRPQYVEHGGYGSGLDQVQRTRFGRVLPHPEYSYAGAGFENDVALIEVLRPFDAVQVLEVADSELERLLAYSGASVTAVGYGLTEGKRWPPTAIRDAEISLLLPADCRRQLSFEDEDAVAHDTTLCAGSGSRGVNSGDSGSPLVIKALSSDSWVQIGVASMRGWRRGQPVVSIYHRVSSTHDWIDAYLSSNEPPPVVQEPAPTTIDEDLVNLTRLMMSLDAAIIQRRNDIQSLRREMDKALSDLGAFQDIRGQLGNLMNAIDPLREKVRTDGN